MKMVCFCEKAHFRFIYTRTCYITTHPIYRKTKAHPIKGVGGEVEDHSKASGLESLCKPNAMKTSFQWLRCSQVYELEVTLGLTR